MRTHTVTNSITPTVWPQLNTVANILQKCTGMHHAIPVSSYFQAPGSCSSTGFVGPRPHVLPSSSWVSSDCRSPWNAAVPNIGDIFFLCPCAIFSNRDRLTFLGGSYCFLITSEWGWTSGKGHLTYLLRTSSILSIRKSIKCLDDFGERERERHRHQENPRVLINIWKYENNTWAVAGLEVQLPTPNLETL